MADADNGRLTPERAVRVLRALSHDLEHLVAIDLGTELRTLHGHLAMVCDLLADHLEHDYGPRPTPPPGTAAPG